MKCHLCNMKAERERRSMASKVLSELGVRTKDENGQLRSVNEVLNDISNAFANLSEEQKVYYSEKLFGKE